MNESDEIQFLKDMIFHRFGLPKSITVDNGLIFDGARIHLAKKHRARIQAFAQEHGIEILNSTPYFAQANGQAESTNKIIKNNLRKVIDNNPTSWDELLFEVFWAYRNLKRLSINTTHILQFMYMIYYFL